jgi:hypothetical protein
MALVDLNQVAPYNEDTLKKYRVRKSEVFQRARKEEKLGFSCDAALHL